MSWRAEKKEIVRDIMKLLYENGMIRTYYRDNPRGWTLISGLYSPLYIQLRPLISYPDAFKKVCQAMVKLIANELPHINKLIGIAMAGVPLAAGIGLVGQISAGFTRKLENVKSIQQVQAALHNYGEHAMLEGNLVEGDQIALIDDLVTKFDSKFIAFEQVKHELVRHGIADYSLKTVIVVLDREQGGAEAAAKAGFNLVSLIPFKTVGLPLLKDVMRDEEWNTISQYLENPTLFQDAAIQKKLMDSVLH